MRLLSILVTIFGLSTAWANGHGVTDFTKIIQQQALVEASANKGLKWTVGDTSNYNLNAGFIRGTMTILVREQVAEGFWLDQNVDLGWAGKQKVEVLIDPNTGELLRMIVNGQEQTPPETEIEILSMEEANITVPAGTFDCIHVVTQDKKNGQKSDSWVNPQLIPINGMLKNISPGQMGNVTIELTSFQWAK